MAGKTEDHAEKPEPATMREHARTLLAEFVGTFALTLVGAGAIMIAELSHNQVDYVARVSAPGLLVMAMIYTLGEISGAHINPAVTLAFALRRAFAWARVPGYWLAQFLGAGVAAGVLRLLFGPIAHLGTTRPHYGETTGFVMELILTALLVSVIIGTATGSKVTGPNAGLAVGATIVLAGLFADPVSGASMNPARSLGPALVGGDLAGQWIYLLGPLLGAVLAVALARALHGPPGAHETEAASGKPEEHAAR